MGQEHPEVPFSHHSILLSTKPLRKEEELKAPKILVREVLPSEASRFQLPELKHVWFLKLNLFEKQWICFPFWKLATIKVYWKSPALLNSKVYFDSFTLPRATRALQSTVNSNSVDTGMALGSFKQKRNMRFTQQLGISWCCSKRIWRAQVWRGTCTCQRAL